MQLCHIHFYQKIARKKVARVNAALRLYCEKGNSFVEITLFRDMYGVPFVNPYFPMYYKPY